MLNTTNNNIINNTTLQQLLTQQQNNNTKQYINFNSKNNLLTSSYSTKLSKNCITMLTTLKNCFTFNLHVNLQYLVVTMYFSNTKKYSYYVINTTTLNVTVLNSIKNAKLYVQQCISDQQQTTTKQVTTK